MLRFDRFEFDAVTRRIRCDGVDIHLPPKAFELLAVLLDAAPAVVPKRALHERLWPGGVVADATLVALVKQLRAALGDRDRATPLIRTVHRVGYALDAPLVRGDPEPRPVTAACWLIVGSRRLALRTGESLVGRDDAADIRIDDPVISRRHARIVVSGSGTLLEDLGSKNGTYVDGRRVASSPVSLRAGSRLAFGTVHADYGESAAAAATFTHIGPADH